jgi:hypothetical protein
MRKKQPPRPITKGRNITSAPKAAKSPLTKTRIYICPGSDKADELTCRASKTNHHPFFLAETGKIGYISLNRNIPD